MVQIGEVEEPRIAKVLKLLRDESIKAKRYLDLGCSDGSVTMLVAETVKATEIYGIDIDSNVLKKAKLRGIKTIKADLSKDPIPLSKNSIDLATAFEVIEHLINPDYMLREVKRVLKPNGCFLITTPNLASWVNRIVLLLGYQPYNAEVSTEILAGVLWKAYSFTKPSKHIRPFTLKALKELLKYHGFQIVKITGASGVNPPHRIFRIIDKTVAIIPSLARRLVVLARKPENKTNLGY